VPRLIDKIRKQDAVLWKFLGEDEFGQKILAPPVQIKVRWEEKTEQFLGAGSNETQLSHAQVFVGERVPERSVLWKGRLVDLSDPADAFNQADPDNPDEKRPAYEVRQYSEQPDMKAKRFLRYVML
jgi:hypothetical protein